jgi:hypothetical protein
MMNGRWMEVGWWSGGRPSRPRATRNGDRGLGEAARTRQAGVLGVEGRYLDVSTRDGDGSDGLARGRLRGEHGALGKVHGEKAREKRIYLQSMAAIPPLQAAGGWSWW